MISDDPTEQLSATWDQPTASIVMHKVEPTKLQALALAYSDKVNLLVEQNERLLAQKSGRGGGKGGRDGKDGRGGRGYNDRGGYNNDRGGRPYNNGYQRRDNSFK